MPKRSTQSTQEPSGGKKKPLERKSLGLWAWDWFKSLAAGLVLFLVIRAFILQTFVITSGSMENTLLVGDLLVLNKVAYGAQIPGTHARSPGYRTPHRGD